MRVIALFTVLANLLENRIKGLINLSTSKVGCESRNLLHCKLKIFLAVLGALFAKHERKVASVAADVKLAPCAHTLHEEH
jgi:hypothetical protein